jgi:hypothetical protein
MIDPVPPRRREPREVLDPYLANVVIEVREYIETNPSMRDFKANMIVEKDDWNLKVQLRSLPPSHGKVGNLDDFGTRRR